jgi:site-specific DNA recombinase
MAMLDAKSAGDERRKLLERTTRGKYGKVQRGKPYCGGFVLYGFQVVANEKGKGTYFEIKESEAEVIRMIFDWYVYGEDRKPLSMHAIAAKLSKMGIPTPGESRPLTTQRKRKPGMLNHYAISRILGNEAYTGTWYYGADNIPVSIRPIVERDLYDQAQAQRERNRQNSPRNAKRKFLLRRMVRCGCGCNLVMIGNTGRHGTRYYRSREKIVEGLEKPRCQRRKMIRADVLEYAAWEWLLNAITNSDELEEEMREAQRLEQESKEPKRDRLAVVLEMIDEAKRDANKLARNLTDRPEGIVRETLEHQEATLNARYEKLCRERDRLQEEIDTQTFSDDDIARALTFQQAVRDGLENATWEDKRYYLETLQFEAAVSLDDQARFTCYLPVEGMVSLDKCEHPPGTGYRCRRRRHCGGADDTLGG